MAMAYTPGLKRKAATTIVKERKLPIAGEVLVRQGSTVSYDAEIARANLPGKVSVINAAIAMQLETSGSELSEQISTTELSKYMLKKVGDSVEKGEILAQRRGMFGLYHRELSSPVKGVLEYYSDVTGQVLIREPPVPLTIDAFIPGTVTKVISQEGVEIETPAAFIQGIFGIGGETHGEIMMLASSPDDVLTADKIDERCSGRIIVGGSLVDVSVLKKAVANGVKGVLVGGIRDGDLSSFMGYDIGVAITGEEDVGLTLILMEGFGKMRMASKTFELLKKFEGNLACINGATQIRAGVLRPEIIIPLSDKSVAEDEDTKLLLEGIKPGLPVRVISHPHFGALARVISLPIDLQRVETESDVRVLEVELEDGQRVLVPRANVELIEE